MEAVVRVTVAVCGRDGALTRRKIHVDDGCVTKTDTVPVGTLRLLLCYGVTRQA